MPIIEIPEVLRKTLGPEATKALVDLFNQTTREIRDEVIVLAEERFGQRLAEELRGVETRFEARLGHEMQDVRREIASLSKDFTRSIARAETRLIRWSFVFWATLLVALFLKTSA